MRKDSWFRGALLSVLFFALILGAPGTAIAGAHDGCTVNGCTSKHRFTDGAKHAEVCAAFNGMQNSGTAMAGVGAVMTIFGPAGMAVGPIVGLAGVMTAGIGATAQLMGGCP